MLVMSSANNWTELHFIDDIKQIVKLIDGSDCFVLHELIPDHAINQDLSSKEFII